MGKQGSYIPVIDGLRAIAVLAVVAFHIGIPGLNGGYAGVDIFFVISGYLITRLLRDEFYATGTISLFDFYARRIRRILPALAIVLLATMLASAFILFPDELPRLRRAANSVALAFSNIHFMQYAGGYFDPTAETVPLLHTWTLAVEEQYYLAWPLLLLLLGKYGGSRSFDGRLYATLAVVLLVSYPACLWYSFHAQQKAFYLMPLRAWELAFGGLILAFQNRFSTSSLRARGLIWIGLLLMALYLAFPDMGQPFPGVGAVLPVAGCGFVIFGQQFASTQSFEMRLLGSRPLQLLGLLSYSWYLWHWPILALSRAYFLDVGSIGRNVPLMIFALLLAILTYRYIEVPVRGRRIGPFRGTRGTFVAGGVLLVACLAVGSTVVHFQRAAGNHMIAEWSRILGDPPFAVSKCGEEIRDGNMPPLAECTYGTSAAAPAFVIWGDSHAGMLAALADAYVSRKLDSAVLLRAATGCPALPEVIPVDKNKPYVACARFNRLVENEAMALAKQGTKGILLVSRWNSYISLTPTDPGGGQFIGIVPTSAAEAGFGPQNLRVGVSPLDTNGSLVTMERSLKASVDKLSRSGLHVVIMAPIPELPFMAPHCLYRRSATECAIPRNMVDSRRAAVISVLNRVVAQVPGVLLWDPINQFCDDRSCYVYRDGVILYGDDDHMSRATAHSMLDRYPRIFEWLTGARGNE